MNPKTTNSKTAPGSTHFQFTTPPPGERAEVEVFDRIGWKTGKLAAHIIKLEAELAELKDGEYKKSAESLMAENRELRADIERLKASTKSNAPASRQEPLHDRALKAATAQERLAMEHK